jgi:hypothetical protein
MLESREPLFDKLQTSNRIKSLCKKFNGDLNGTRSLTPYQFFEMVRKIPYRKDPKPIEVVARPKHILNHQNLGMDCKKKAILLGSYFEANKIPYRFIGSSRRQDKKIHHIFPQAMCDKDGNLTDDWTNFDATYSTYSIAMPKAVTAYEVL